MTIEQISVDSLFHIGGTTFVKTSWSGPSVLSSGRCHRCFRVARGLNDLVVQHELEVYLDEGTEVSLVER